jgi:hypothetical protein
MNFPKPEQLTNGFIQFLLAVVGLLPPGIIVIFHFNRALFLQLDDIKLILLSGAFTALSLLPLVIASLALLSETDVSTPPQPSPSEANNGSAETDFTWRIALLLATLTNTVVFSISFTAAYFVRMNFKSFVAVYVASLLFSGVGLFLISYVTYAKNQSTDRRAPRRQPRVGE